MRQVAEFFQASPSSSLYHYTSIDALLGIDRTNTLWASHAYYLNDSKEIIHACDVLQDAAKEDIGFKHLTGEEGVFAAQVRSWIRSFQDERYCIFVFSLSEVPSLLSQWRSYTPHGKGISLELSPRLLREILKANDLRLAKCIYEGEEQRTVLASLFAKLLTTFRQHQPTPENLGATPEDSYYSFLEQFRGDVLQVLSIIKHPAFKEEREWRLISRYFPKYSVPTIKFRGGASLLVPYIELALPNGRPVFERVILGPTPHENLSMSALSMYLSNSRLCQRTENSQIPYRKW